MSDQADTPDDGDDVPQGAAVFPLIPAELGVDPILLAMFHCVVFIAGSDQGIVDSDAGDEALLRLEQYLRRLAGPRLDRVREDMLTLVGYAKSQKWSKAEVRSLKDFLNDFNVGVPEGEEEDNEPE